MNISMEATDAFDQIGPNQPEPPTPPVPGALAPRATTSSYYSGISQLTLPVLVLPVPRLLFLPPLVGLKPRLLVPLPVSRL